MAVTILVVATVAALAGVKLARTATHGVVDKVCYTSVAASRAFPTLCGTGQTALAAADRLTHGHVRLAMILTLLFAVVPLLTRRYKPKRHIGSNGKPKKSSHWRHTLAESMESPTVSLTVLTLICVDVCCTVLAGFASIGVLEGLVGEGAVELAETLGFRCLCFFLVEQLLHLAAFGSRFFSHPWFVSDLSVVLISIVTELFEASHHGKMLRVIRTWKVLAILFDSRLAVHEAMEYKEGREDAEKGHHKSHLNSPPRRPGITGPRGA
eukprot:TRINITY_DN74420_c0_g1_i1.p1 TRINITY_DN74420_c0_g1~~TRINITY_DN74420_c0_g1_i1.p1  ORF type:complete len:267 (-),score=26.76 TRINITY_DN74420_c0_g1_i1:298-1098(-)